MANAIWALIGIIIGVILQHVSTLLQKNREQKLELYKLKREKIEELSDIIHQMEMSVKDALGKTILNGAAAWQESLWKNMNIPKIKSIVMLYFPNAHNELYNLNVKLVEFSDIIQKLIVKDPNVKFLDLIQHYNECTEVLVNLQDKCLELLNEKG